MKAIGFPEANIMIAEDQPEYNTLPAHFNKKDGVVVTCFELTGDEIMAIIKNRKIWVQVLTFGRPLQPFSLIPVNNYFNSVVNNGTDVHISNEKKVNDEIDNLLDNKKPPS